MDAWLAFGSTLIWQAIVFAALYTFRAELRALLKRIARFKHGETEIEFQQPAKDALAPRAEVAEILEVKDDRGFLTEYGVRQLIERSGYLSSGESVKRVLLVFRTEKQRTWLISSNEHVFYVLDDERTRAREMLVQRKVPISQVLPVAASKESQAAGSFSLGKVEPWYYSMDLLGPPRTAKQRLEAFVTE